MLICLWTCKSQICFLSKWTIGFLFYNNKGLCFHRNFQVLAALDSLMEFRLWDFFRDSENDLILSWWEDFWNYGEQTESITEQNSVVFLLITWFLIDFHFKSIVRALSIGCCGSPFILPYHQTHGGSYFFFTSVCIGIEIFINISD